MTACKKPLILSPPILIKTSKSRSSEIIDKEHEKSKTSIKEKYD